AVAGAVAVRPRDGPEYYALRRQNGRPDILRSRRPGRNTDNGWLVLLHLLGAMEELEYGKPDRGELIARYADARTAQSPERFSLAELQRSTAAIRKRAARSQYREG